MEGKYADRGGIVFTSLVFPVVAVGDITARERKKTEGGGMELAATGPYCRRVEEEGDNVGETTVAEESDAYPGNEPGTNRRGRRRTGLGGETVVPEAEPERDACVAPVASEETVVLDAEPGTDGLLVLLPGGGIS